VNLFLISEEFQGEEGILIEKEKFIEEKEKNVVVAEQLLKE
jgi:hypothetical protein